MKTFTKLMSVLLIVVMCVSMFSSGASAAFFGLDDYVDEPAEGNAPAPAPEETPAEPDDGSADFFGDGGMEPVIDSGNSLTVQDGTEGEDGEIDFGLDESITEDGMTVMGAYKNIYYNGQAYSSLASAVAKVTTPKATITLNGPMALSAAEVLENADVTITELTLNLNGKALNLSGMPADAVGITLGSGVDKLVVTGGGVVTGSGSGFTMFAAGSGAVEIVNGSYKAFGIFGTDSVTLKGGSYYGVDPTATGSDAAPAGDRLIKGTEKTDSALGTYTLYTIVPAVAKLNSSGVSYATLAEAISAADAAGDAIQILNNVSGESLTFDKDIELDLNGKTLKESSSIIVKAELTVKDSAGDDSGKIVGASSTATLFDIKNTTVTTSQLNIEGGYMSTYGALYKAESTAGGTPVWLTGGLYEDKPAASDYPDTLAVYGKGPYALGERGVPTITSTNGSVVYNSEFYLKSNGSGGWVNKGVINHLLKETDTAVNTKYTLLLSSADLDSVECEANSLDITNDAVFDANAKTVVITKNSPLFTGLIAGRYDITFTFSGGTYVVKIPLYVLPNVKATPSPTAIKFPTASLVGNAAATYTFGNAGELAADKFESITFDLQRSTRDRSKEINLLDAANAVTIDGDEKILELAYDYLNENYVAGGKTYTIYFNYDVRRGFSFDLTLKGTTLVTTATGGSDSSTPPTSNPTGTTASVKLNAANSTGKYYKGLSAGLKFDINPADATVYVGTYPLTEGTEYTVSNKVLTLKQSYLNGLTYMHANCVNGTCANGSGYTLSVTSSDGSTDSVNFQVMPSLYAVNDIVNHTYGGTKTLSFTASDPISKVIVGGAELNPADGYYTLSNNNKTVTLTAAFMNKQLWIGNFTLYAVVTDGDDGTTHLTSCGFNIVSASSAAIAEKMGDSSNVYIWIAVIVICAIAVIALIPKKKKQPADPDAGDKKE